MRSSFSPRAEQQYLNALCEERQTRAHKWTQTEHALEVAELAEEGARGDDAEAGPQAPDEAAEDGDDLMAEEGRERDDKEDTNRDRPAEWETNNGSC